MTEPLNNNNNSYHNPNNSEEGEKKKGKCEKGGKHHCMTTHLKCDFSLTNPYNNPTLSSSHWPQNWKRSIFIPTPKNGNAKECSNHTTIIFILHTRKVMLKMLKARLQQNMNQELPDVQAEFRKGRRSRDQIANICQIIKKSENSRKTSTSASLTTLKPLSV